MNISINNSLNITINKNARVLIVQIIRWKAFHQFLVHQTFDIGSSSTRTFLSLSASQARAEYRRWKSVGNKICARVGSFETCMYLCVRKTRIHAKQFGVQLNIFRMNELYFSRIRKCIHSKPHENRQQSINQTIQCLKHCTFYHCLSYLSIICLFASFIDSIFLLLFSLLNSPWRSQMKELYDR